VIADLGLAAVRTSLANVQDRLDGGAEDYIQMLCETLRFLRLTKTSRCTAEDGEMKEIHSETSEGKGQAGHPRRDWTQFLPDTEHVRFLKSVDWSKTDVGPIADWPNALRQATYQVIADSRPATLYW
jgi:hypothetical protein